MRDAHFKIIHDRREGIKRRTIRADQHGVGNGRKLHAAITQYLIAPGNRAHGKLEAPIRLLAIRQGAFQLLGRHFQRFAIIERRLALAPAAFALVGEFFFRLEAGIKPPGGLQLFSRQGIAIKPC